MSARVISSRAANGSSISRQRCAERERPHQADALLHAARQLVGVGVDELAEADLVEELDRVRARARGGDAGG